METQARVPFWESSRFDLWLSALIGFLTLMSFNHIVPAVVAAIAVSTILKIADHRRLYAERREFMVRLPVRAL